MHDFPSNFRSGKKSAIFRQRSCCVFWWIIESRPERQKSHLTPAARAAHVLMHFTYQMETNKNEKKFHQLIIPHLHKHRINKKIARDHLHCKRDCKNTITTYVDIIWYVYLNQFFSLHSVSCSRLALWNDIDKS